MFRSLLSSSSLSSLSSLSFSLPFSSSPSFSPFHTPYNNYFDRKVFRTKQHLPFAPSSSLLPLPTPTQFSSLTSRSFSSSSLPLFSFSSLPKSTPFPPSPSTLSPLLRSFLSLSPRLNEKERGREKKGDGEKERGGSQQERANKEMAVRLVIFGLFVLTLGYFSVPLYRMFCASTGFGGSPITDKKHKRVKDLTAAAASADTSTSKREFQVEFATTVQSMLPWTFEPTQPSVVCKAGQSVLAFFTATNHSDKCVIGVATYNILPDIMSKYFIKVQCFCFDEQRLLPGETVDMPVLFYIDPAILADEYAKDIHTLTLSYVFFKVHEYDLDEELGEEKEEEIEKRLDDLVGPDKEKERRHREERERNEKEKEKEKGEREKEQEKKEEKQ